MLLYIYFSDIVVWEAKKDISYLLKIIVYFISYVLNLFAVTASSDTKWRLRMYTVLFAKVECQLYAKSRRDYAKKLAREALPICC